MLYSAAGGTGIGVYQAAKDEVNWPLVLIQTKNIFQPGNQLLTSMLSV